MGLAITGVLKFGTADELKGLGTGKTGGAIDLILSKNLNYKADLHASIGYQFASDPDGVNIGDAFKWGVGFNLPACEKFGLQAELMGISYGDADFDRRTRSTSWSGPCSDQAGHSSSVPPSPTPSTTTTAGQRRELQEEDGHAHRDRLSPGNPVLRGVHAAATATGSGQPAAHRLPQLPEGQRCCAGETTDCRATAADPDGDALTYTWSTSAGRVTGSGADAKLDTTGVPCGTTITVTVSGPDGRGGTASATDTVRVVCPEKAKPEAVTCTSGGFPRNLARLNNVDKACLDDVASRLRQDPRSRVVIVGHADKGERNANVVARKRAEAVKSLPREGARHRRVPHHGTRGRLHRPLDTGTSAMARAKNRRVDVIFVPEGATVPEDDD